MIKAAVFDLDHTLFDRYSTLKIVAKEFRLFFDIADGITDEYITEKFIYADKQFVHIGWPKIHKYLIESGFFRNPPTFEEYSSFLLERFHHYAVPFPFTRPMLLKLRESGIKTGLITNGSHELQYKKLEMVGIGDCFDSIIATRDIGVHKPERGPFDIMAARLRLKADECLYIGDNPLNDVEASRRAGYIPVWIKTTGTWCYPEIEKPELQAETVEEIPAIIEKLNSAEKE